MIAFIYIDDEKKEKSLESDLLKAGFATYYTKKRIHKDFGGKTLRSMIPNVFMSITQAGIVIVDSKDDLADMIFGASLMKSMMIHGHKTLSTKDRMIHYLVNDMDEFDIPKYGKGNSGLVKDVK